MIILKLLFSVIFGVNFCYSFERNENFHNRDNETFFYSLVRKMEISDYKTPAVDHLDYLQTLGNQLFKIQPPFDFSSSQLTQVSEECRKASTEFIKGLNNFELWALKMHDSAAKIPSGILNGHVNQYGDFDSCLSSMDDVSDNRFTFQSQYCLAGIQLKFNSNHKFLNYLRTIALSFELYRSEFKDPNHVIPKTSQINWGFCIPSSCSSAELQIVLKEKLENFFNSSDVSFGVEVRENMCQKKISDSGNSYSTGTALAILFVVSIFVISIVSTVYDSYKTSQKNEWLTAFSLKKNWADLISLEVSKSDISSPHGVRFIAMIMLIISHKGMEIDFNPMTNRNEIIQRCLSQISVIVRASYFYTDSFIMLSGMLVAYSFYGRLQRGQKINYLKEVASRYFRVMPPVAGLIIFGTFLFPLLGSGPTWPMLVTDQSELCKRTWWRNFLMIHNWFGFENICMTHTHHVGTDFGLFLVAPFLMTWLHRSPKSAKISIAVLAVISTIARFLVVYSREITVFVLYGVEVSKLYEIASFMYILPPYRFTIYSLGLMLGYYMRKYKNFRFSKMQINFGWFIMTVSLFLTIYLCSFMSVFDYKFNAFHAALYASIAHIPWCLFFAWTIFTAHLGYKNNYFVKILEWRGFQVTTKLSYGIYLVQFAVFHYNNATVRSSAHAGIFKTILNAGELLWIVLAASVLTLFIEYPFGNMKKLIFDNKTKQQSISTEVDENQNLINQEEDNKIKKK